MILLWYRDVRLTEYVIVHPNGQSLISAVNLFFNQDLFTSPIVIGTICNDFPIW